MSFGFTFNGINSMSKGLVVTNVKRDILPPLSTRKINIPGRAGVQYFGSDMDSRMIEVDVFYEAPSLSDMRTKIRDLASWLTPENGLQQLSFDDETSKYYLAVLDGDTEWDEIAQNGSGTLTFFVPDPLAYGASVNTALGSSITNNGTAKAYPTFTVTFTAAASYFKISKSTDAAQLVLINTNFVSGDVLVINHEKNLVTKNGLRIMPSVDFQSYFFPLDPGANSLNAEPLNVATVNVQFIERWL